MRVLHPRDVQLRWMDLSQRSRELLSGMAGIVRSLDPENALSDLEPIDVAKGLVSTRMIIARSCRCAESSTQNT